MPDPVEASSMYYTEGQADLFEKRYQQYGQISNTNRNASETQEKSFQQWHATLNAGTNRTYTSSFRTGYRILSDLPA